MVGSKVLFSDSLNMRLRVVELCTAAASCLLSTAAFGGGVVRGGNRVGGSVLDPNWSR